LFHENEWFKHAGKRSDPGGADAIPESYGEFVYYMKYKDPASKQLMDHPYDHCFPVYLRHDINVVDTNDIAEQSETIIDLEELPWVQPIYHLTTSIDKITVNDDHSLVAFTLDIGNTEVLTGGVKDMRVNKVIGGLKLNNVCQIEFTTDNHILYTETEGVNRRPFKVSRMSLETLEPTTIFTDSDPTHFIDLTVSKDRKFFVISSNTKEDSEVWVIPRI